MPLSGFVATVNLTKPMEGVTSVDRQRFTVQVEIDPALWIVTK